MKNGAVLKSPDAAVGLSPDGPAFIHDAARVTRSGKGTFEPVAAALKLLQQTGVSAGRRDYRDFSDPLTRRGVDISRFDLAQLTQFTAGWTGAEIEQCVISAITRARLADREVTESDLVGIAARLVPLSRTMKEQISKIRGWAFERAIRASPPKQG